MPNLALRSLAFAILGAGLAFSSAASATNARVAVPDRPGDGVKGCYRIAERLYGPYSMTFCLEDRGYYRVTGGGLNCDGRLSWRERRGEVSIDLRRSECGRRTAWSADRITCQVDRRPDRRDDRFGVRPRVAVPDRGRDVTSMRCTYSPSERGYRPMRVTARSID